MSGMSKAERDAKLAQRNASYYAGLSDYPPSGGVSEQDLGMGFLYTPDPYPTRGMAPAPYDAGKDHPFGFDPRGYVSDPLLEPETEDKIKKDEEEEKDFPSGSYEQEPPQSTNMFGQPVPRPPRSAARGYANVTAPSQWLRDQRYVGGQEFGKSSLQSFAGLLTEALIGTGPRTGKRNLSRYPSLFDYV